jgi:hypothetical protein
MLLLLYLEVLDETTERVNNATALRIVHDRQFQP